MGSDPRRELIRDDVYHKNTIVTDRRLKGVNMSGAKLCQQRDGCCTNVGANLKHITTCYALPRVLLNQA